MRAQSKPFVVEIKSSRRTDRSKPKSIWGDLDLSVVEEDGTAANASQQSSVPRDVNGGVVVR